VHSDCTIIGDTITTSAMLERYKNWRNAFEDLILTCNRFSSNTIMRGLKGAWMTAEIRRFSFTVLDRPPYGPNLAPSDFRLFPEHLRGHHFSGEVQTAVKMCCGQQDVQLYRGWLTELPYSYWKCVTADVLPSRAYLRKITQYRSSKLFVLASMTHTHTHMFPLLKKQVRQHFSASCFVVL
jgi:hypothetical protein